MADLRLDVLVDDQPELAFVLGGARRRSGDGAREGASERSEGREPALKRRCGGHGVRVRSFVAEFCAAAVSMAEGDN